MLADAMPAALRDSRRRFAGLADRACGGHARASGGRPGRPRVAGDGRPALVLAVILAAIAAATAAGCGRAASPSRPQPTAAPAAAAGSAPITAWAPADAVPFVDRAAALGVAAAYRAGAEAGHCTILESLGGGVGWLDYDRDGWLDLVAPGGGGFADAGRITGLPTALFRSRGGRAFVPAAEPAGIADASVYSHGVAVGDVDNDGFPDLLVTGYGPARLWHNRGDGTFAPWPAWGGEGDARWSSSAGFADCDGDGCLDLYLARYVDWSFDNHPVCGATKDVRDVCPPRLFAGLPDSLYLAAGDGTFADASARAGLRTDGKGLGVLLADVDVDGDIDIYVANDTTDNFLYVNDGRARFRERGLESGVALDDQGLPNGSMGVDLCDYNRDGLPDIWVTNYERESFALYRGEGQGQFLHVSRRLGITALGGLFVGFGTACADFDADGLVDVVVADGHVIKYPDASPRRQLPLFLRFDGRRFARVPGAADGYFGREHEGRGLAAGDFDGDGDLDLAVSHIEDPLAVLENGFDTAGRTLVVDLVGTRSNRDAVGARVTLDAGGERLHAQVKGGGSYLSHGDRRLHLMRPAAAGAAVAATLVVDWPAGARQEVAVPADCRMMRIIEDAAIVPAATIGFAPPPLPTDAPRADP